MDNTKKNNSLKDCHSPRFNTLRCLHLDQIHAGTLVAEIVFKGIAVSGTFKDFLSKDIENTYFFDVLSLDFNKSMRWIRINRCNNRLDLRNRSAIFKEHIETSHSVGIVPSGVLINSDASTRNSERLNTKFGKRHASQIISKSRRCGSQRHCFRNV